MDSDFEQRLVHQVRELREARGLSQEAFAERAGLKYKHYQSIEGGRKIDLRLSTLRKLARACELRLGELLLLAEPGFAAGEDVGASAFQTGPRPRRTGSGASGRRRR